MYPESYWNYRLKITYYNDGIQEPVKLYSIVEVYYNKGNISSVSCEPVKIETDGHVEDIKWTLEAMLRAFDKPILDENNNEIKDQ